MRFAYLSTLKKPVAGSPETLRWRVIKYFNFVLAPKLWWAKKFLFLGQHVVPGRPGRKCRSTPRGRPSATGLPNGGHIHVRQAKPFDLMCGSGRSGPKIFPTSEILASLKSQGRQRVSATAETQLTLSGMSLTVNLRCGMPGSDEKIFDPP